MFSFFKKKLGSPPSITPVAQAATAAQPGTPDAVPAVLPPPATSPAGATVAPAVASAPDRIATSRMRPAAAQPGLPEAVGLADSPTTSSPVCAPAARQAWMEKLPLMRELERDWVDFDFDVKENSRRSCEIKV